MLDIVISFALLISMFSSWILYRARSMSTWHRLKIPGPKPHFLHGNCLEIREKGLPRCHLEWTEKYGKNFGYYIGGTPYFVLGDEAMVKKILTSHFDAFPNRPVSSNGFMVPVGLETKQLIFQSGDQWKSQRTNWKSFFNPKNIEEFFPYLDSVVVQFLTDFEKTLEPDQSVDIYQLYQDLTMVIIGKVILGLDETVGFGQTPKVISTFRAILNKGTKKLPISIACFPEFDFAIIPVTRFVELVRKIFGKSKMYNFVSDFQALIDHRRGRTNNNNNSTDFLTKMTRLENNTDILTADCFATLFGGFETISITLLHVTRVLVKEMECQEKLRKEIKLRENRGKDQLDYQQLGRIKYLDGLLKEVLRLYNPVPGFIRRQSTKDCVLADGTKLQKGTVVQIPMAVLHRNPQQWEKPDHFNSERFLEKETSDEARLFFPFGAGRRNCVAAHFAMTTMKVVIYRIFERFRLDTEDDLSREIPTKNSIIRVVPKSGFTVKLEKMD